MRADIDDSRRRWRGERPGLDGPDRAAREPLPVEERSALFEALQALPPVQRRTVVLRHWLGLSITETAQEIGVARDFAAPGKPVIIGETLILHNSAEEQREWLLGIRPDVDGYLGFFDGRYPEAVTDSPTDQVYGQSLAQMIELRYGRLVP